MDESRLKDIARIGVEGFWGSVKKNFPYIKTEDVDPQLAARLAEAAERVALDWGRKNDRDAWTEIGSVIKIHFADGSEEMPAYVWNSDHATFRSFAFVRPLDWQVRQYKLSGIPDPGLVRLDYESPACKWFLTGGSVRREVEIFRVEDVNIIAYRERKNRRLLVISEIVTTDEPEIMRIMLPEDYQDNLLIELAIRRLVGELNMVYHAHRFHRHR